MGMSEIVARGVALVGATAIRLREHTALRPAGLRRRARRSRAARPAGRIPTLKMPTARGWSAGRTPVAAPGLEGQRLRHRPQASALDPRPAERRRADRRVADRSPASRARVFDYAINATMKRAAAHGPEPEPHHPPARRRRRRRRRDPRDLSSTSLQPALRHGARRRHLLRRQHRRPRRLPLRARRHPAHRPGQAPRRASSPAATGPAACCRAPTAVEALRRRRLAQQHRRARHGGRGGPRLRSTSSTSPPAQPASSPAACATRSASPGSPSTGALWTVVNERDGLGDETPPDYLTSVRDGGFYGWP